ncbi:MAG: condensation domain-containing protein, partial [Alphaproteobacteria bacterium]
VDGRHKAVDHENGSANKSEIRGEIAALIGDLLKRPQPKPDENFFEIGGHSLKAVRLANLIQDKFGVEGCLPVIFNSPTLNQIASFVEDNLPESSDEDDNQNSATTHLSLEPVPATRAQARFFLLHQLNPSSAYNVSTVLKLTGSLDLQCLQAAFYATMRRHEGLRTQFDLEGDRVVQIVKEDEKPFLDFQIVEVPGISERELKKKLAYEASCVFDLTAPPAVIVRAFRTEQNVIVIGINTHHVRIDGDSLRILTGDLSHFYNCAVCDTPSTLAPVLQPSDLASWEAEQTEFDIDTLEKFWREHLEGAPSPVVFAPQLGKQGAASHELNISRETWRAAKQIAKPHNMGPYPVLIGAYALALGQLTGRNDIVIGNVVSQRTRAEMQNIVAPLLNTLPIRLKLPEQQSSEDYLQHVRKVLLETREHGGLQLDEIVEKVNQDRQQSNGDIFQSLIAWQAFERTEVALDSLKAEDFFLPETDVKADFSILLTEFGDDNDPWLCARFTVDAKKLDPSTAVILAQSFEEFLKMLVKGETLNVVAAPESSTQNISSPSLSSDAPNSTNQITPILIEQVRACWARILGIPGLQVSDDIFLHGAHSLAVLRLAKETGQILGWKLPAGTIFNARTCQRTLSSAAPRIQHDQLVAPLDTLTGSPSIFLFPDISGQLFSQRFLANELSLSFDVWGVQFSLDLDLPDNFEALAKRIANALISVDSPGPYHLVGYSFGVQLMAHTAAILEAEGHAVHSLIALDALPQAPGLAWPELTDEVRRWTVFADVIARNQFNTEANIDEDALRLMSHQDRAPFVAEVLSSLSDGQVSIDTEIVADFWDTFGYLSQLVLPAMPPINNS